VSRLPPILWRSGQLAPIEYKNSKITAGQRARQTVKRFAFQEIFGRKELRIGSYATFSKVDVFGALGNISISCALSPGWILLFTCQLAVVLVHIFPAEHFFSSCFDELFAVYGSLSSLFR
jgi:hypothetical protein